MFLSLDGAWLLIMSPLPDREFEEGPTGLRLLSSAQRWVNSVSFVREWGQGKEAILPLHLFSSPCSDLSPGLLAVLHMTSCLSTLTVPLRGDGSMPVLLFQLDPRPLADTPVVPTSGDRACPLLSSQGCGLPLILVL